MSYLGKMFLRTAGATSILFGNVQVAHSMNNEVTPPSFVGASPAFSSSHQSFASSALTPAPTPASFRRETRGSRQTPLSGAACFGSASAEMPLSGGTTPIVSLPIVRTRTQPCLCRQCGHDCASNYFSIPKKQTVEERRALLSSLGAKKIFDKTTIDDFLYNPKTQETQRISRFHFSVEQLVNGQGGHSKLRNNAVADIPLLDMVPPTNAVGHLSRKRKQDQRKQELEPASNPSGPEEPDRTTVMAFSVWLVVTCDRH